MLCQLPYFYILSTTICRSVTHIFLFCISLRWLMVPYRDNGHLTRQQSRFNEALSSQRQVIERALLKGRWHKLQYLNLLSVKLMTIFIMAACVLHNFYLLNDDFDEGYLFVMIRMIMSLMLITP